MSADKWFIARDKKKLGPFTTVQMKQMAQAGQLLPIDMVIKDGTTKWMPASQAKEFFPASKSATPPPSSLAVPATPAPSPAEAFALPLAASIPTPASGKLLGVVPLRIVPPIIGMSAIVFLALLASFFCGSYLVFFVSFLHNAGAVTFIVLTVRLQKSLYALLAVLLTMTAWAWLCFTAVWTVVSILGLLAGIAVGVWALFAFFSPEGRRQFSNPNLPAPLERLPTPALAGILGGASLTLILGISMAFWLTTRSNNSGGRSANDGANRKTNERTMKSRVAGPDGVSFMAKAVKATGAKPNPSLKPAEPGSLQDFFDALGLMCLRMHNVPIRPGAKIGIYFDDPGCKASIWHEVFGEPEPLPKGRERIGKVNIEFERWRHKCTDGSLTFQGQILERDGKISYYSPKFIIVD